MHYLFFVLGVLLLVIPAGLLSRLRRLSAITLTEMTERPKTRRGWIHWINGVDFLRAWLGLELILHAFLLLDNEARTSMLPLLGVSFAALIGLSLQQAFFSLEEEGLVAPVAYLMGLTFAQLPPLVALLVLVLGSSTAFATRSIAIGLSVSALASAGMGAILGLSPVTIVACAFLLFLPVLVAGIADSRLVITVRHRGGRPAPVREVQLPARATR